MIQNIKNEIRNLKFQLNLPSCINKKDIEARVIFLEAKLEKLKLDSKQFLMDFYTHETYSL